jgi:alpha 1,2-mannosyltransferase
MEFKSRVLPVRPERERRWKPLLLGLLVLSNVVYVVVGILLVAQSPDIREDIILDDFTLSTAHTNDETTSAPKGSTTNISQVVVMEYPSNTSHVRRLKCLGWRATRSCSPDGARKPENDLGCSSKIPEGSGYCEIKDTDTNEVFRVMKRTCAKGKANIAVRCVDAPGFANFRAETQQLINKVQSPDALTDTTGSRGIVMVVYPALLASAYATIRALRDVLDCQLPLEIWFRPDEMRKTPGALKPLEGLTKDDTKGGITFSEINHPRAIGFGAKIYAVRYSRFDQLLFLDADNVPVRNPAYLFEAPEFVKTGAIFWPDYWHPQHTIFYINEASLVWQLLDMSFVDMFEQESGQLLIDRRRHAASLELVAFYSNHRPNYFSRLGLAWGDKDLFRFAWLKRQAPFHMITSPPSVAGKMYGGSFCGMTMVQHDPKGKVLFLHRNQLKLTGKPVDEPSKIPQQNATTPDYPDPAMWTHLLSFRSGSPRSKYIIQGHWEPQFSDKRRCFGRSNVDRDANFYAEKFADLSFAGLETRIRQFAMEAAQYAEQKADRG